MLFDASSHFQQGNKFNNYFGQIIMEAYFHHEMSKKIKTATLFHNSDFIEFTV